MICRIAIYIFALGYAGSIIGQTKFEYPELLVSPSAFETLEREQKQEKKNRWMNHIPSQIPALLNVFTGLRALGEGPEEGSLEETNQEANTGGLVGLSLGGGWLAITAATSLYYSPYKKDYRKIKKLPAKNKRQRLIKERRAEEVLADASNFGRKMKYLGIGVNALAAASILGGTKDPQTEIQAGVTLVSSLLPLLFDYDWTDTYYKHQDYKKKIYAPLVEARYIPSLVQGELAPGISLKWQF